MVFNHQTFSIFAPLAIPWDPNLDPCDKSVILTGVRKILIKVLLCSFFFVTHPTFSSFAPLAVSWDPIMDPCDKNVALTSIRKIQKKPFMFFYPADIFDFQSFGCPLGSQLRSLLQKCDPDRCTQNSHKSRLCSHPSDVVPVHSFGCFLKSHHGTLR